MAYCWPSFEWQNIQQAKHSNKHIFAWRTLMKSDDFFYKFCEFLLLQMLTLTSLNTNTLFGIYFVDCILYDFRHDAAWWCSFKLFAEHVLHLRLDIQLITKIKTAWRLCSASQNIYIFCGKLWKLNLPRKSLNYSMYKPNKIYLKLFL